jgi:hypothetical protein
LEERKKKMVAFRNGFSVVVVGIKEMVWWWNAYVVSKKELLRP